MWGFVGRDDELRRLIDAGTNGTGRGLIIGGTSGVGKSRLLREGLAGLSSDRIALLTASANAATANLPLGGLTPVLPADQPPGLTPAGLLRWAVTSLRERAAGRPIVFAIDDAHLLDAVSATLVYLVARENRAAVLGTLRSGEPVPASVRALWIDDLADYVELPPFTRAETTALVEQMVGGQVDSGSVDRFWRLSAGNALLLRELIIAAQAGGEFVASYGVRRWTGRLELAPTLTDLVDARIGQLPPGVRAVVELVAFGEPVGLALLVAATDPAMVELAEERGLIRVVHTGRRADARLGHPLYGEVVRRHCPVTRRRRVLAELAGRVEQAGARRRDDMLRVAVWRLDSGTGRDPAPLLRAGQLAFARYDIQLAERLARAAREAGGGFEATELLATILIYYGQWTAALQLVSAAAGEAVTELRRTRWLTLRVLATYLGLGRVSAVDDLARAASGITDPANLAWVRALESILRMDHLECGTAQRLAQAVLDQPASSAAARALALSVLGYLQAARGRLSASGRTIEAAEQGTGQVARRTDAPYFQMAIEQARGVRLMLAYDVTGIEAVAAAELADLFDAGDFRLGSGFLSILRSQAARWRGQARTALAHSRQACAVLAGNRVFAGLAHAERAYAAALCGQCEVAAEAMAESDRTHPGTMAILYPWREQARAWVSACTGDLPTAAYVLHRLVAQLRADGFAGHEVLALHDLVRLGQDAKANAQRLDELAQIVDGPVTAVIAGYARARAETDGARLIGLADQFTSHRLHLFAAEAATCGVGYLRAARSPALAAATAVAADLRARCRQVHSPTLATDQPRLTAREAQIARLAGSGVPSKDIAEQLYLSARTVDNHLRRIYAKLGIGGRSELAPLLRTMADSGSS